MWVGAREVPVHWLAPTRSAGYVHGKGDVERTALITELAQAAVERYLAENRRRPSPLPELQQRPASPAAQHPRRRAVRGANGVDHESVPPQQNPPWASTERLLSRGLCTTASGTKVGRVSQGGWHRRGRSDTGAAGRHM